MTLITQALKSRTVLKAIVFNGSLIIIALLTELEMLAVIPFVNMIADIFLRSITKEPLSAK